MNFQKILNKQNIFKSKKGEYFQMILGNKHPTKNGESNNQDVNLNDLSDNIDIYTHNGPNGVGFTVIEKEIRNGQNLIKKTGHDFYSQTHDWQLILKL